MTRHVAAMQAQYRIETELNPVEQAVTLLLNGRFGADALPALAQSIAAAKGTHRVVYLDLSEVTLVDRKAVRYLCAQVSKNVKLVNCPLYLRRWLTRENDGAEN